MKAGGYNFGYIRDGYTGKNVIFNLSTGVVSSSLSATGSITSVGNGWYRCSATMTTSGSLFRMDIGICSTDVQTVSTSWTGDGFSGIYIWGAQLEAGSFATSYIPTVASQMTRSADRASMSNIGSLLNTSEGTLYISGNAPAGLQPSGNSSGFAVLSDGTNNNRVRLFRNGLDTNSFFGVISSGVTQANIGMGSIANNSLFKMAGSYKTNDFAVSLNSAAAGTDTLGTTVAALNNLDIGHQGGTALTEINSSISKIAYYPKRLTNAELQGLTTV
jgi:hypothetical protein